MEGKRGGRERRWGVRTPTAWRRPAGLVSRLNLPSLLNSFFNPMSHNKRDRIGVWDGSVAEEPAPWRGWGWGPPPTRSARVEGVSAPGAPCSSGVHQPQPRGLRLLGLQDRCPAEPTVGSARRLAARLLGPRPEAGGRGFASAAGQGRGCGWSLLSCWKPEFYPADAKHSYLLKDKFFFLLRWSFYIAKEKKQRFTPSKLSLCLSLSPAPRQKNNTSLSCAPYIDAPPKNTFWSV